VSDDGVSMYETGRVVCSADCAIAPVRDREWSVIMNQSKGLTAFVRDECANYGKHDEACLFGDSCKEYEYVV